MYSGAAAIVEIHLMLRLGAKVYFGAARIVEIHLDVPSRRHYVSFGEPGSIEIHVCARLEH